MRRVHLNAIIDGAALVGFMALASSGFVLRYQLPPGSGELFGRGTGRGAMNRQIDLLWGFTRHEWGDVHYWIALGLLAVLSVHLLLHWNWIVGVLQGKRTEASGWRLAIGLFAFATICILMVLPMVSQIGSTTRRELQQQRSEPLETGAVSNSLTKQEGETP
jgi:hypothetical protein